MNPSPGSKRVVVCCDGTWNRTEEYESHDSRPTNVLKLLRALESVDPKGVVQVKEYVRGIGTGNRWDRYYGGATGEGIDANIEQAYQFIANNYRPGDDIFLFGFSRGACTIRSLSGFLHHFGILPRNRLSEFPIAYHAYRTTPRDQLKRLGLEFVGAAADTNLSVPIQFIGVWDTVCALGNPLSMRSQAKHKFHDTELAPNVAYAYHALAVHEYRSLFVPTLWTKKESWQTVEQVWFAGSHSNVGGGLELNGLSDLTLSWMIAQANERQLCFEKDVVSAFKPDGAGWIEASWPDVAVPTLPLPRDIGSMPGINQFRHASLGAHSRQAPRMPNLTRDCFATVEAQVAKLSVAPEPAAGAAIAAAQKKKADAERSAKVHETTEARIKNLKTRFPRRNPSFKLSE